MANSRLCSVLALLGCPSSIALADFDYNDFSSTEGLALNQDAVGFGTRLRLAFARESSVGTAYFNQKQIVRNGFETTFEFVITEPSRNFGPGDGFSFIIQNEKITALGGGGGGEGFSGISNSLAVEFDVFINCEIGDPLYEHVAVQTNETGPNSAQGIHTIALSKQGPRLSEGGRHAVRILYEPNTLAVYVDSIKRVEAAVDLDKTLRLDEGKAWVGFTGATGGAFANFDIFNWFWRERSSQFSRGDATGDGVINIVDPIRTLEFLFSDGVLSCLDAADADDNGRLEITDAIGVLGFLFLGTFPPAAPLEECGGDPSADQISCEAYEACDER